MTPRARVPAPRHGESVPAFAAVGIAATLVHAAVGLTLESAAALSAFVANLIAFSVAFLVSYFGHRRFSFRSEAAHSRALPRFGAVALTGLALNQMLVLAIVNGGGLPYAVALAVIVATVPALTYVLSRLWAFR
jgi:putative flippase GtrA